ncbi:MAG: helix-turn-helix transcriptional regulator [Fusobacterium varium]|uniref:helix-turn-helix domain-containing protein n=1 Tax=Fusobacterium varium TaxID=856 RepID=UPI0024322B7F|nr:helix-turn-helix transcriptional regulator [Fusobacterium varium]UYI77607.1 MAG: helix-turn-helix transcriptional regulator [Fusobacterium varium]
MYDEVMSSSIKQLRKEKKITQKELGQLIGKTEITIRKYEKGDIRVSFEVLRQIIKKIGIDLEHITKVFENNINLYLNGRNSTEEESNQFLAPLFEVFFELNTYLSEDIKKQFIEQFKKNKIEFISDIEEHKKTEYENLHNNIKDYIISKLMNTLFELKKAKKMGENSFSFSEEEIVKKL